MQPPAEEGNYELTVSLEEKSGDITLDEMTVKIGLVNEPHIRRFLGGVMYQSVFSLTRNLLIVWPFFHLSGVMIDFAININAVERISDNLP